MREVYFWMFLLAGLVRFMVTCVVSTRSHFNIQISNILYLLFLYLGRLSQLACTNGKYLQARLFQCLSKLSYCHNSFLFLCFSIICGMNREVDADSRNEVLSGRTGRHLTEFFSHVGLLKRPSEITSSWS